MGLGWCAYFDDFPLLACEGMEEQIEDSAGEVFEAMGVQYAKEGKKATKFGAAFNALGLTFDLSEFQNGVITIKHTDERRAELKAILETVLQTQRLSPKEAEVLRGRMHWYSSYLFGRAPCEAMHQLSLRARGIDGSAELGADLAWALRTLWEHVDASKPLELKQTCCSVPGPRVCLMGFVLGEGLGGTLCTLCLIYLGFPWQQFYKQTLCSF